jgi:glutamate racemase
LTVLLEEMLGGQVKVVDSATAVASAVKLMLTNLGLSHSHGLGTQKFYVTDAPDRVASVAGQFWSVSTVDALHLEHIDLLDHS